MNAKIKKQSLGQFFTKNDFWLKNHILKFINSTKATIAFDPFAGGGDLLRAAKKIGFKKIRGLDIDNALDWEKNDSLLSVPKVNNSIIITNPPYLTNYSAKRRGIYENVKKYFDICSYDDIYQLAIEKCFNNDFGVMIIPETFINSKFPKNRLVSITIIEDQLFNDTENPICVICFDNRNKQYNQINVYKNEELLGNLEYFEKMRKVPHRNIYMKFNAPKGQIALRAVDTTNPQKPISFMKPEEIDYDLADIKHSSRLITVIEVAANKDTIDKIIKYSNSLLVDFRKRTSDVLLSPFKGNKKNGERRRRLDYMTARAFLEDA
ncbi:MAG: hypothetical protein NTW06_03345, partial [Candidatus Falkowbacteria bacterium]|nr:hypothetical protein [Candidatus Falkowbacteria bacterium]